MLVLSLFRTFDNLTRCHFRLLFCIFINFVARLLMVYIFRSQLLLWVWDLWLNDFLLLHFLLRSTLLLTHSAFLDSFLCFLFIFGSSIVRSSWFILIILILKVRLKFWFLFQSLLFLKRACSLYQRLCHIFFFLSWNYIFILMNLIFLMLFWFSLFIYTLFIEPDSFIGTQIHLILFFLIIF